MCIIHAVGLGPGDEKLITKEGETLFRSGLPLYLRTEVHPSVEWLKKEQIRKMQSVEIVGMEFFGIVFQIVRQITKKPIFRFLLILFQVFESIVIICFY